MVMGVLAVKLQSLNQELEWDGENMRFTNIPVDAKIRTILEDGFKITDSHPTFNKTWTEQSMPLNMRMSLLSIHTKMATNYPLCRN